MTINRAVAVLQNKRTHTHTSCKCLKNFSAFVFTPKHFWLTRSKIKWSVSIEIKSTETSRWRLTQRSPSVNLMQLTPIRFVFPKKRKSIYQWNDLISSACNLTIGFLQKFNLTSNWNVIFCQSQKWPNTKVLNMREENIISYFARWMRHDGHGRCCWLNGLDNFMDMTF